MVEYSEITDLSLPGDGLGKSRKTSLAKVTIANITDNEIWSAATSLDRWLTKNSASVRNLLARNAILDLEGLLSELDGQATTVVATNTRKVFVSDVKHGDYSYDECQFALRSKSLFIQPYSPIRGNVCQSCHAKLTTPEDYLSVLKSKVSSHLKDIRSLLSSAPS